MDQAELQPLNFVLSAVLLVPPLWRICTRAGFSPALSLIAIVPGVGFLVLSGILAFGNWQASVEDHS
jgi:hypothetical protein